MPYCDYKDKQICLSVRDRQTETEFSCCGMEPCYCDHVKMTSEALI